MKMKEQNVRLHFLTFVQAMFLGVAGIALTELFKSGLTWMVGALIIIWVISCLSIFVLYQKTGMKKSRRKK